MAGRASYADISIVALSDGLAEGDEPYPTPRSWTNTVKLLAAAESVTADKNVRRLRVNGCVGDGAGSEFTAFLETQALPDPEDVLADPQTLRLHKRGDLAVAIVRRILARVETDNSIDRWERCCDVFERAYRQSKDIAMAGYGRLWKLKPAMYQPPKRNGVFAEMDRLRNG